MKSCKHLIVALDYVLYLDKIKKKDRWKYDKLKETGEVARALKLLRNEREALGDVVFE